MKDYLIAPSILSADFARLGEEVNAVLDAGADVVHFDVMDNHYVPNLTIGPMICEALRNHKITAPIDVHLMVSPVDQLINDFAKAGASYISFHPEATGHVDRSLQLIRELGCKSGLVFNPGTPIDCLEYLMDKVDVILLMSVNPGFGGQKSCSKYVSSSTTATTLFAWKLMVVLAFPIFARSQTRVRICSWPAQPSLTAMITQRLSPRCDRSWDKIPTSIAKTRSYLIFPMFITESPELSND
jgi:ribulose-phosphate 3-epimerase